jgi:hypothetical protein
MICPDKIAALPIDDRYKEAINAFCSIPDNASACELLCDAPPDVIAMKFQQVEDELASYVEEGVPPELAAVAQQQAPEFAQAAGQFLQEAGPSILAQERESRQVQKFAKGGLASLGRFGDQHVAHVQKGEMVVPNHVLNDTPGLRAELGLLMARRGADPARYTVGGRKASYNPRTGRQEFFSLGGIIGGVVGFAVGGPIGAAIGAGAGTMVDTGDPLEALGMAAAGFGLGTFAAGAGFGAAAGAGAGGAGSLGAGLSASEGISAYAAGTGATAGTAGLAGAADAALIGSSAFPGAAAGTAAMSAPAISSSMAGAGALGGGVTAGEAMLGGLGSTLPTASTMFPAAAPAATTTAASAGGGSFLGGLWDKAAAFATEHPFMTAGLAASTVLPSLMTPEMPTKPGGGRYDLQTDPSAQYGYYDFETLGPSDLFGNIDQMGSGVPGTPGTPQQVGAAINAPSGYSYAQNLMQAPAPQQQQLPMYNAAVAPWNVPSYASLAEGGHVRGAGTATSDSIPAYLSDGEFVMTNRAVRGAGGGNLREGARRLYAMMDELERRA